MSHKNLLQVLVSTFLLISLTTAFAQDAATPEGQKAIEWRTRFYAGTPIKKFSDATSKIKLKGPKFSTASPAIYDGVPYVGTDSALVVALAPFEFKAGFELVGSGSIQGAPALTKERVYIGFSKNMFAAFERETGKLVWKYETKGPVTTTPLIHGKVVYFTTSNGFCYALDAETGSFKWKFNALSQASSPAFDNDIVYIGTAKFRTYAINAKNGDQIWENVTSGGQPTLSDLNIYVTNKVGSVICLDKATGTERWSFKGDLYEGTSDFALANNTLVVGNITRVFGMDSRAGSSAVKWTKTFSRPLAGAPIIVGDVVYAACMDWNIYALDLETGKEYDHSDIGFAPHAAPAFGKDGILYPNAEQFLFLGAEETPTKETATVESGILYNAEYGKLEELKSDLAKTTNVDTTNGGGKTPLMLACEYGFLEAAQFLKSKGANIEAKDTLGRTALMYAAWYNFPDVVSWLITTGAKVNVVDGKGYTALEHASIEGRSDVCKMLLANGIPVDHRDTANRTSLMHAAWEGKDETVEMLLDNGASINAQNNDGKTALMYAATENHPTVCALLLKRKADASLKNKDGKTALDIAKMGTNEELIRILSGKKK